MFPAVSNYFDLYDMDVQSSIIASCKNNPEDDHVYYFPDTSHGQLNTLNMGDAVIAGSAALRQLMNILHIRTGDWKPTDVDCFFIGCKESGRQEYAFMDVVMRTETSVPDLLMTFDLPVCRVAMRANYDIWVSAQALHAIWTRKYYIPEFYENKEKFGRYLLRNRDMTKITKRNKHLLVKLSAAELVLTEKLLGRIEKYKSRDFTPVFVKTTKVTPFILARFTYVPLDFTSEEARQEAHEITLEEAVKKIAQALCIAGPSDTERITKLVTDFLTLQGQASSAPSQAPAIPSASLPKTK